MALPLPGSVLRPCKLLGRTPRFDTLSKPFLLRILFARRVLTLACRSAHGFQLGGSSLPALSGPSMQAFLDQYRAHPNRTSLRTIDLSPCAALTGISGAGVPPGMLYMPGRAAGMAARPEVAPPVSGENNGI